MTRDEVMALSVEELQVKAAELLGWTEIRQSEIVAGLWGRHPSGGEDSVPSVLTVAWELWDQIDSPKEIVWQVGCIVVSWGDGEDEFLRGFTSRRTAAEMLVRASVLILSNKKEGTK